ncbi:FAD-dependent oxidoreductase [Leucobacter coleopterorum]|uniref:FAD-dependent oxidoreductase n=1 Tax=Leucobacter coleopterorum TaxID=2714933 RepID=A0ABX6JTD7_9MICO|nr:FAD-dependent oxidoreductase [Leucobacter coleopterorum]QIM17546.1 FAD-dependent oxidoreductase [Leucobacter coleopterorum]
MLSDDGETPRVAIIGGGIAGLVAAWELARNGINVVVFEREARLGGRVCAGELGGVRFDLGPESYATRGGEVERLLADLGLQGGITATSGGRSWIVGDGRESPLPAAGAIGIPSRPWSAESRRVIGIVGAVRCAIEPWLPRRIGQQQPSLGGLVRVRLGQRTLDRLVAPVVRGVYSANPYELPLEAVPGLAKSFAERGSLRSAARQQRGSARASGAAVAGLRGGVHTLVAHLEQELERLGARIHLGAGVTEVRALNDGDAVSGSAGGSWSGPVPDYPGRGYEVVADGQVDATEAVVETVDAVLVTVPGILTAIKRGADPVPAALQQTHLSSDESTRSDESAPPESAPNAATPIEVIAILVDDARLNSAPRGTGALVAEDARRATPSIAAKALTHVNVKWAWLAEQLAADHHLLRLSYGEHGAAAVTLDMSDSEVKRLALADAGAILGLDLQPAALKGMARRVHAMPRKSAAPLEDPSPSQRIFTAGEWVAGTGFAAVIPSARASAQALREALATTARPSHA